MKTLITFLLGAMLLLVTGVTYAETACGGIVQFNDDCSNSGRGWHYSCCPDGYRVQGVAYNDIKGQDHVDAISAVCRSISKGNDIMTEDFSRQPKTFVCDKSEVMAGTGSKDVLTDSGSFRDSLDGVTAFCQKPGSDGMRRIGNGDIDGNKRAERQQTVLLPKRIVGIGYKEFDKGESDRADCVAIVTK